MIVLVKMVIFSIFLNSTIFFNTKYYLFINEPILSSKTSLNHYQKIFFKLKKSIAASQYNFLMVGYETPQCGSYVILVKCGS